MTPEETDELSDPYSYGQKYLLFVVGGVMLVLLAVFGMRSCRTQNQAEVVERFIRNNSKIAEAVGEIKNINGFKNYSADGMRRNTQGRVAGTAATIDLSISLFCSAGGNSDDAPPGCKVRNASFYDPAGKLVEIEVGTLENLWLLFK